MKATNGPYEWTESRDRIKSILDQEDINYEEVKELPNRDQLTFTNGFYAMATCLTIDIRSSSSLPDKYKRPKLARLYRSFISEAVAVINSHSKAREVNVAGDGVWGVINTPKKDDIDEAFSRAAMLASMVDVLNCLSAKKGFDPISVGIGADYGRALMIKAGYFGSGLNEVVYMGDVVNRANKMATWGSSTFWDGRIMVSSLFHHNLKEEHQGLLRWNSSRACYDGNVINVAMNEWVKDNCQ